MHWQLTCVHLHVVISAAPVQLQLDICTLLDWMLDIMEHRAIDSLCVQHKHLYTTSHFFLWLHCCAKASIETCSASRSSTGPVAVQA